MLINIITETINFAVVIAGTAGCSRPFASFFDSVDWFNAADESRDARTACKAADYDAAVLATASAAEAITDAICVIDIAYRSEKYDATGWLQLQEFADERQLLVHCIAEKDARHL